MPTETQEKIDLDTLKEAIKVEKVQTFDRMALYMRLSGAELSNCGHKTMPGALEYYMRAGMASVEKLTKAFLKKSPD